MSSAWKLVLILDVLFLSRLSHPPFTHTSPLINLVTILQIIHWIYGSVIYTADDGNICSRYACRPLWKSNSVVFPNQLAKTEKKGKTLFPMQIYAPLTHISFRSHKKSNLSQQKSNSHVFLMLMKFIIGDVETVNLERSYNERKQKYIFCLSFWDIYCPLLVCGPE